MRRALRLILRDEMSSPELASLVVELGTSFPSMFEIRRKLGPGTREAISILGEAVDCRTTNLWDVKRDHIPLSGTEVTRISV